MISLVVRRWQLAFALYIITVLILVLTKPSVMFRPDGTPKAFGSMITEDTSIFAPAFVIPLLAFVSYFVATMIEMVLT
jgi:hypothetical protein